MRCENLLNAEICRTHVQEREETRRRKNRSEELYHVYLNHDMNQSYGYNSDGVPHSPELYIDIKGDKIQTDHSVF